MDPDVQGTDRFDLGVPIQASGLTGRGPALANLPIETGLSHGGMCCLLCPNVGCRVSHFIRLADDNPAHLCCQHDLHELYGESAVNSPG